MATRQGMRCATRCDRIARARAAPSCGSVPAPSSSNSTRVFSSARRRMRTMLRICPEKVDSDCSMDCSSPISAKTLWNTLNAEPERAGMCRPDCAISTSRPTVFSVDRLAARVRAGDDHREGLLIQHHIDRHNRLRIEQRVAGLVQADDAARVIWPALALQRFEHRLGRAQIFGILGAHQRQVNHAPALPPAA